MIKKFIFIILFFLNIIVLIKSDNYNLNDLKKLINIHIENIKKIAELEKKLINYKFSSGNELLNIINRKNIEKNIQKRNLILKEINNLTSENSKISEILFKNHDLLYNNLKNNYLNNDFIFVVDYIDNLKVNNLLKVISLNADDAQRLYKEAKIDVLRLKYESQSYFIKELEIFINKLKLKANLIKDNERKSEITKNLELLTVLLTNLKNSQQNISIYLK